MKPKYDLVMLVYNCVTINRTFKVIYIEHNKKSFKYDSYKLQRLYLVFQYHVTSYMISYQTLCALNVSSIQPFIITKIELFVEVILKRA